MDKSKISIPDINELNIYEGGTLNEIKAEDLLNNETAIKQLINSHNLKIKEFQNAQRDISNLNSEIEYLKTSPFVSILASIINIVGSTVGGLSVNFLTADTPPKYAGWLLFLSIILIITGSLATILYPYAKSFFNSAKK